MIDFPSFKWNKIGYEITPTIDFMEFNQGHQYREIVEFNLARFCELEITKNKWQDIHLLNEGEQTIKKLSMLFAPNFEIVKVLHDDVGFIVFKIYLIAKIEGMFNILYRDYAYWK